MRACLTQKCIFSKYSHHREFSQDIGVVIRPSASLSPSPLPSSSPLPSPSPLLSPSPLSSSLPSPWPSPSPLLSPSTSPKTYRWCKACGSCPVRSVRQDWDKLRTCITSAFWVPVYGCRKHVRTCYRCPTMQTHLVDWHKNNLGQRRVYLQQCVHEYHEHKPLPTHLLKSTHPPIHPPTHSPTHPLTHPLTHSLTQTHLVYSDARWCATKLHHRYLRGLITNDGCARLTVRVCILWMIQVDKTLTDLREKFAVHTDKIQKIVTNQNPLILTFKKQEQNKLGSGQRTRGDQCICVTQTGCGSFTFVYFNNMGMHILYLFHWFGNVCVTLRDNLLGRSNL